ncbi:interleukin-6 receptor subunit alpha [Triplophysa rosa]|uniref:Interleukin-6 receptor subunit alpha n=1 Tax=Triplophysa rosa TaxID=992332 RepID=A0A9W7WRX4_TRIRA|nr:interleukin-6 receptor subunit alpha [Triplophysa rosa]KAI7807204.1 interleukin-6 receptor subunit alpha [Triplophysa rosa]
MWNRSTLKLLVCALSAVKVHCYREEDELCPRKEPPPGVLVLKIGSNVVLGCRGDVTVNDVPLVSATVVHKKHRNRSEVLNVGFTTQSDSIYVDDNSIHQIKASSTTGTNTKTSRIYTEPKENTTVTVKPSVTIRKDRPPSRHVLRDVDQPTQSERPGRARQEEAYGVTMGTNFFSEEDEYDDYDYEEERSRVTRGIKKRTRWTLNGRQVRVGVERGGILRLPHLSLANAGNYSCYRGDRLISTTNISVGASPERPTIFCYRKSHTSKVRCDWTSKEPITPLPLCYLLLKTGFWGNVTRIHCSFSRSRCWCAFPVEEGDRTLHVATLCVTNTVGSATSPEILFKLQDIIKPDPPTKVEVRAVEGKNHMFKVSWSYPRSWKNVYYTLHFHLRYRPQQAEKYQTVWIKETLDRRLSWMIFDALPHTMYEIQIQAKDEFDGLLSDWTDTVFGMTWSNNNIHIAPETTTTFGSNSLEMFPVDSGGSGEGPGVGAEVIVGADDSDAVGLCVSAVCGLCCFVALMMLTVYFFRHRLRLMSTVGKESLAFSSLPRSPPLPPPTLSVQLPKEGNSLMSPINHNQQRFLPDQQEEQEGIHLHNIHYFLTLATEGVPLTISSSLQET